MNRIAPDINSLEYFKKLYLFLEKYQLLAQQNQHSFIVSLSLKIPPIDPLAILKLFASPKQPHFYLEKPINQEFVLAIGKVFKQEIQGQNRFFDAQLFIDSVLSKIIIYNDSYLAFAKPRFFCSFSFFANSNPSEDKFPDATIFLPELQVTRNQQSFMLTINLKIGLKTNLHKLIDKTRIKIQQIFAIKESLYNHKNSISNYYNSTLKIQEKNNLQATVELALQSIYTKKLSKLVIAHNLDIELPSDFKLTHTLNILRQAYSNCYTFSISNNRGLNFIGTSPERLLQIKNNHLATESLAGSMPRGKTEIEDHNFAQYLLNNHKYIKEHKIVRNFIIQKLINLNLNPLYSPAPQLLRLSNIQHLWTPIKAKLIDKIQALDLVAALHPTPAVAGIPQNVACQQIRNYETFERNLYAAPLGWIDYQGNSEFVVGIRSALLKENNARLYAGAGIVAESNSKIETEEIMLKFQPLLSGINPTML